MKSSVFQDLIFKLRKIIDRNIGIINENKNIIASSDINKLGQEINIDFEKIIREGQVIIDNVCYKIFGDKISGYFAFFCEGSDDKTTEYVNMSCLTLESIKKYEDEKNDKTNFIKNVILDNILPGDVYIRAREMNFSSENFRVVVLIRIAERMDVPTIDIISNIFPDRQKDFVFKINDTDTVLVKEVKKETTIQDIENMSVSIIDTLDDKYFVKASVGIGSIVDILKDLSKSFREAQMSLEVGKVFDIERSILSYNKLGVGRLIYQLPNTVCDVFLREVFKKGSIESLDSETLFTIQRFFENNLNVSETSRGLFIHRNTLVYRLEKIKKITGLDLREFDNAIVFKIALMVKKYLQSNPTKF